AHLRQTALRIVGVARSAAGCVELGEEISEQVMLKARHIAQRVPHGRYIAVTVESQLGARAARVGRGDGLSLYIVLIARDVAERGRLLDEQAARIPFLPPRPTVRISNAGRFIGR